MEHHEISEVTEEEDRKVLDEQISQVAEEEDRKVLDEQISQVTEEEDQNILDEQNSRVTEAEDQKILNEQISQVAEEEDQKILNEQISQVAEEEDKKVLDKQISRVTEAEDQKILDEQISRVTEAEDQKILDEQISRVTEAEDQKILDEQISRVTEAEDQKILNEQISRLTEEEEDKKILNEQISRVTEEEDQKILKDHISQVTGEEEQKSLNRQISQFKEVEDRKILDKQNFQVTKEKDQTTINKQTYSEIKTLVSTFPIASGGSRGELYRHMDGWYASMPHMIGSIMTQKHFVSHSSDILIATLPKSGTTWLKTLIFMTVTRHSSLQNNPLISSSPHGLVLLLESQVYNKETLPDLDSLPAPRLFGTHIPYCSLPENVFRSGCKIVYLYRDAKDNFVSLWHFVNKVRERENKDKVSIDVALDQFCNGVSLFGPYWDHVLGYWNGHKERPQQVLFMKYEELKENPVKEVKRLAEFVGYGFKEEEEEEGIVEKIVEMCGFDYLVNMAVNKGGKSKGPFEASMLFRRGVVGDWMNHLSSEMAVRIDEISKRRFEGSDLE